VLVNLKGIVACGTYARKETMTATLLHASNTHARPRTRCGVGESTEITSSSPLSSSSSSKKVSKPVEGVENLSKNETTAKRVK
jgi:hypothetical protein